MTATTRTRRMTATAMLSAIATVLMYLEFPLPFFVPPFIKMDFSEVPALIAGFAYGPAAGVVVCLIKNLFKIVATQSFGVGELFNFTMGALFVGLAAIVYRHHRTRRGAAIGALIGAAVMAVVSVPFNYFVVYPAYMKFMPIEAILGMYQAINPGADGLLACLLMFNLPFTLIKGLLDAAVTFLIYKPLSPMLHGKREEKNQ